jgi:Rod binding domain-containing protein
MADGMLAGHLAGQRAFGVADAILKQLLPARLNKNRINGRLVSRSRTQKDLP